jgi:hypothetical protein
LPGWWTREPTLADHPLLSLARVLGGVILTQGRLGHQVLGQMLIMGSHEVAIAGASVVVAASSRQKNAVGQIALRTAAPAIAVSVLLDKQQKRIALERQLLDAERRKVARLHAETMHAEPPREPEAISPPLATSAAPSAALALPAVHALPVDERLDAASAEIAALRKQRRDLQRKLARLTAPPQAKKKPAAIPPKRKRKRPRKPRKP